mgnify:CR=1 FL=1
MENIAIKNYLLQHNVPCITPKAALIDMDGVLYDSMKNHVEAWYRTLTPMGFKCSKEEFYLYEGRTGASTIKYLFDKHFGKQVSDDECAEIYKIKEKHLKYVFVFFICVLSYFINFYWAPFAFILVFIIHMYRDDFRKMAYYIISLFGAFFIVGLVFKMMHYENQSELDMMIYQVGCILPLPLIARYTGQEGIKLKWIVYVFYILMLICFMLLLMLPKQLDPLSFLL